jgi:hypothetical protein
LDSIRIPVNITNISNADNYIYANTRFWNPNGLSIFGGFGTILSTMRAGASQSTYLDFADHGDGVYIVEFSEAFASNDVDVIITLPITRR